MNDITANWSTLLDQASMTADTYFREAVKRIDDRFGKGYAEAHPELIAAFIRVAGDDFRTAAVCKVLLELKDVIENRNF